MILVVQATGQVIAPHAATDGDFGVRWNVTEHPVEATGASTSIVDNVQRQAGSVSIRYEMTQTPRIGVAGPGAITSFLAAIERVADAGQMVDLVQVNRDRITNLVIEDHTYRESSDIDGIRGTLRLKPSRVVVATETTLPARVTGSERVPDQTAPDVNEGQGSTSILRSGLTALAGI